MSFPPPQPGAPVSSHSQESKVTVGTKVTNTIAHLRACLHHIATIPYSPPSCPHGQNLEMGQWSHCGGIHSSYPQPHWRGRSQSGCRRCLWNSFTATFLHLVHVSRSRWALVVVPWCGLTFRVFPLVGLLGTARRQMRASAWVLNCGK